MKILHVTARLACVACLLLASTTRADSVLDQQRMLFRTVHPEVELGNWDVIKQLSRSDSRLLRDYVLWPDLRATWLKANIKSVSATDVDTFLQKYGTLKPARELRYRYALNLVRDGDLASYLRIYEQFYQGLDIAQLDCLALQAELKAGRQQRIYTRALELWTVGKSQVKECDPVFDHLKNKNQLSAVQYETRFKLAIKQREFGLARWLGKSLSQQHVDVATEWQQAQSNPEDFARGKRRAADSELLREQLAYAIERLTYRDPEIADDLWREISKRHRFHEAQKISTEQHIALWMARDNLPGAYQSLSRLSAAGQDAEVLRWRARTSLRMKDWNSLLTDIALMDDAERQTEEWRYWHAIALQHTQQVNAAGAELLLLSKERSYYGFLSADEVGQEYALDDNQLVANEERIAAISARPEIVRARELFKVGQDSRGRSEWDAVVRYLDDENKLQAAILADRWGWHSRAIATAASLGEYDDLSLRYPLPYQKQFEASSSKARIAPTWAYGIARSESLFMRDVRSHAGAVGLMQLMPATGRQVAKELKLPYAGVATLVDPQDNIRLGTTYLSNMAERYGGNHVLATAAYNAGPHRVDRWLPLNDSIDAKVWIENIPFNETRKYVKRVLAAQTIFHWRITGSVKRLTDTLPDVEPPVAEQRIASR